MRFFFLGTWITFSASFAIRDGVVIEFWPIESEWQWCIRLAGLASKILLCRILHAWSFPLPPDCYPCAQQHCCKCRALTWKEPGFLGHTVEAPLLNRNTCTGLLHKQWINVPGVTTFRSWGFICYSSWYYPNLTPTCYMGHDSWLGAHAGRE